MMQKLVRNNGKRPLVVLCCFKKNVPKVNKKSELIDMIEKIPLLRNMRSRSLRSQCAVMFQKSNTFVPNSQITIPNIASFEDRNSKEFIECEHFS